MKSRFSLAHFWPVLAAVAVLAFLFALLAPGVSAGASADRAPSGGMDNPVTVITVNSGTDPDNSKSKKCSTATPCTLRRAIVQARALSAGERPVLINFNIPATPAEGYDSGLKIWKIHPLKTSDPSVFRRLEGGQITIDGSTQPGGRADGPKIVIVGPDTGNKDGLIVGVNNSGSHDGNVIRGLAFQNFKTHLIINSNDNTVENNWFGLADNGTDVFLRDDEPEDGSGSAGVALSAGVEDNVVQNNVFLGFDGVAAALRGERNTFSENFVGTTAAGTVPGKQTEPDLICTTVDWLGGGGISLEGEKQTVTENVFAGLRQEIFQISTQPDAIRSAGSKHTIQYNVIGMDENGAEVGVCGRGIYLISSPQDVQVLHNMIVNPGLSGISLNGVLYDANTLRGNGITRSGSWPQVEGNPKAEDAIQLGPSLPDAFVDFQPAKITAINGLTVSGTSGSGSPCPKCTIEVFLDDIDGVVEAQPLTVVATADSSGNWTARLSFPLAPGYGLRTTSTTARYNTIPHMSAGTTTGLSVLYRPANNVYLPSILR